LGVTVADPDPEALEAAGVIQAGGAEIVEAPASTPGGRGGFLKGDIVVEFDGERVRSAQHFSRLVGETPAGRTVNAVVARGTARRTLRLIPEERRLPSPLAALPQLGDGMERGWEDLQRRFEEWWEHDRPDRPRRAQRRLGVSLLPLESQLARYFGVTGGVLVASVEPNSAAAAAGLVAGDIITAINGRGVTTPAEVSQRIREAEPERVVTFSVTREKKAMTLHVTPNADERLQRQRTI
jgi:S1-C subfamily serine protease